MNLRKTIDKALTKPPHHLAWLLGEFYQPYYYLMYLLSFQLNNALCVELGVERGRGLVSLALGNSSNLVVGFDTVYHPEIETILASCCNALFFQKPSLPVPDNISQPISLLHIDTEHSFAMAQAEFEAYRPHLAPGAFVLFDDLHAMEDGVLEFFNSLPYEKIQEDKLHPICGYGVLVYE